MSNDFQFLDAARADPEKVTGASRSLFSLRQPLLRMEVPGAQLHPQLVEAHF